ncbi:serine/threonine-protein kinase haspin-like [Clupea harengus]|uniref:Serine/threonine-protein kinase haspin-like n=1 Tax=Clupea harengus TaxID=7950 RepID=A0A6P8ET04_CLUHA|nr:serine/threonine-protein kinase haspin-like [Clupea harengus]XP_031415215.1 serine/threonine-protein kinase haspin-like [Clupea harengus]
MSSWLALPITPARAEQLNISSILAGFSPDTSLSTHMWSRLKAALSVHKKKTAFITPRRLALTGIQSPAVQRLNASRDIFASPSCTSLPHLVQSSPSSFLIIPADGKQKVNGEDQKSFGEILHEMIISKELSSLDQKDNNRTNGFISLNNLRCVQGTYPSQLLNAWDKFDKQRGSENDRPDFFGEEQFFLVLEFEFGGSDLENMNGKLSSLAQMKSILQQVTAALAVDERALCFEHRDLHWGNILVKTTKQKECSCILNGK